MSYDKVKQAIANKRREVGDVQRDNKDKVARLKTINRELEQLENKEINELKVSRENQLREAEADSVKEIEDDIAAVDEDIETVKEKFEENKAKLTPEKFLEEYTEDMKILDEVNEISMEVQETAKKLLGDEMSERVLENLDSYEIEMNNQDLEEYINRHDKIIKSLNRLQKDINFNFYIKIDKILAYLNPSKNDAEIDNTKLKNSILIYVLMCGSLSFVILYFASSWVFAGCVGIGVMNMRRSASIRKLLIDAKALADNIERVKSTMKEYATEDSEEALYNLNEEFQRIMDTLTDNRREFENELEETLAEARKHFKFDDSTIKQSYKLSRKSKEKEITDVNKGIVDNDKRLVELKKELFDLNQDLEVALKELRKQYLTFKGNAQFFDPVYVVDINDAEVTTWEHPESACLILYDGGINYTSNFIRLFIAQTMSKFSCCSCLLDVWDTVNLASSYRVFTKTNDDPADKSRGCCSVMINEEEVENSLMDLESELKKRIFAIKQEKNNITEYNKLMVEVEGTCKEYRFLIMDNFSPQLLTDNRLTRILATGNEMGIYTMIFYRLDDFMAMGQEGAKLLRNIERVYMLEDNKVQGLAKSKILDRLEGDA